EFRQRLDLPAVEEIGGDAFDAGGFELLAQAPFAEAGNADHALAGHRALGETGERRSNLAGDAENDDVAGKIVERRAQRRRRRGHHLLEVVNVAKAIGQCGGGLSHSVFARLRGRVTSNQLDTSGGIEIPARARRSRRGTINTDGRSPCQRLPSATFSHGFCSVYWNNSGERTRWAILPTPGGLDTLAIGRISKREGAMRWQSSRLAFAAAAIYLGPVR